MKEKIAYAYLRVSGKGQIHGSGYGTCSVCGCVVFASDGLFADSRDGRPGSASSNRDFSHSSASGLHIDRLCNRDRSKACACAIAAAWHSGNSKYFSNVVFPLPGPPRSIKN